MALEAIGFEYVSIGIWLTVSSKTCKGKRDERERSGRRSEVQERERNTYIYIYSSRYRFPYTS